MIKINETQIKDLDNLVLLWNNPQVIKYVGFKEGLKTNIDKVREWHESMSKRVNSKHFSIYNEDKYCGEVFYRFDTELTDVDIKLLPEASGLGIGEYALCSCMIKVFCISKDTIIKVDPHRDNTRAIALYKKLGFTYDSSTVDNTNIVYYCGYSGFRPSKKVLKDVVEIRMFEEMDSDNVWKYTEKDSHYEWEDWNGPYFEKKERMTRLEFNDYFNKYRLQSTETRAIFVEDMLIGEISCYWIDKKTRWLEIGIIIYDSTDWSKGYGRIALANWITGIFNSYEIERVGLTTWSGNQRMMKAATALGMKQEAVLRKVRYYNGVYYDSVKYGVLREEWFNE